jgi:hypothetical protein
MNDRPKMCADCKVVHSFPLMYRVHDELWAKYARPDGKVLCMPCFERRLGRPLEKADLTPGAYENCRALQRCRAAPNPYFTDTYQKEFDLHAQFLDETILLRLEGKGNDRDALAQLVQKYESIGDASD